MKIIILTLVTFISVWSNEVNASLKYECSRYVDGNYKGWTSVFAKNKEEAEEKAFIKFKDKLNKKVDYVSCK